MQGCRKVTRYGPDRVGAGPILIYYEPAGRLLADDLELMASPPEGYEFVLGRSRWSRLEAALMRNDYVYGRLSREVVNRLAPVPLLKAYLECYLRRPPRGAALTYARNHVVLRREPWVVFVESASSLTGYHLRHLLRYRTLIERHLASSWCRGIIVWSHVARESICRNFKVDEFAHKIHHVPLAVRPKRFVKTFSREGVRLLFVGTVRPDPWSFHMRGGKEVLEAYMRLRRRYHDLSLTVRSQVPEPLRSQYTKVPGVRILDRQLSAECLDHEFRSADIFVLPTRDTPFRSFLDAMSYELPVVTIDDYANAEIVTHGTTGIVINCERRMLTDTYLPVRITDRRAEFDRRLMATDGAIVERLAETLSALVEAPEKRRRLGENARRAVERGPFSVKERNKRLGDLFETALVGAGTA